MKEFDLEAAKKGAKVCTRDEREVRILCFGLSGQETYKLVAAIKDYDYREDIYTYTINGLNYKDAVTDDDLMMADDDYKEKLARGEYGTPATSSAPAPDIAHVPDPVPATYTDPWDEFKRQAALSMIQSSGVNMSLLSVEIIIDSVNRIVDGIRGK